MTVNVKTVAGQTKSVIYFLLSFGIAMALTLLLKEPEFTDSQIYVLFLLFFAVGLWITEAIPAFAVSLFIIAYLVFALEINILIQRPKMLKSTQEHFLTVLYGCCSAVFSWLKQWLKQNWMKHFSGLHLK